MLNKKWITGREDDELAHMAVYCDGEDLAEAIKEPPTIFADSLLNNHDAATIAQQTIIK
jgi:hypothetical protein